MFSGNKISKCQKTITWLIKIKEMNYEIYKRQKGEKGQKGLKYNEYIYNINQNKG